MKYVILTFLLSPLFVNVSVSDFTISTDLNEIILDSDLIVYAKAIDDCTLKDDGVTKQFVQFDIVQTIKGKSESSLSVNTDAIYSGDIPHQLIESNTFGIGQHYLLFFQFDGQNLSLLINHSFVEIQGDSDDQYFLDSQSEKDSSIQKMYKKGAIINSIESFLYNETEILDSEILAVSSS